MYVFKIAYTSRFEVIWRQSMILTPLGPCPVKKMQVNIHGVKKNLQSKAFPSSRIHRTLPSRSITKPINVSNRVLAGSGSSRGRGGSGSGKMMRTQPVQIRKTGSQCAEPPPPPPYSDSPPTPPEMSTFLLSSPVQMCFPISCELMCLRFRNRLDVYFLAKKRQGTAQCPELRLHM